MGKTTKESFELNGTQFDGRIENIELVKVGDPVHLEREPDNPYDCFSIHAYGADGKSLGHVPAEVSRELSPLIDSGRVENLSAAVDSVTPLSKRDKRAKKPLLSVSVEYSLLPKVKKKTESMSKPKRWCFASATGGTMFAVAEDGSLWARGYNRSGGCGCGDMDEHEELASVAEPGPWLKAFSSFGCSYGLKEDGTVWAWGDNKFGSLAENARKPVQLVPVKMTDEAGWKDMSLQSTAGATVVLLREDGTLWRMGSIPGNNGPGGAPSRSSHLSPIQIGTDSDWDRIYSGSDFSFAIKKDGSLWVWGSSWEGALGMGKKQKLDMPTRLGKEDSWAKIAPGYNSVIALKNDFSIWGWGDNQWWQLGLGDDYGNYDPEEDWDYESGPCDLPCLKPTSISSAGDNPWVDIAIGDQFCVALREDGSLWTWGHSPGDVGRGSAWRVYEPGQYERDAGNDWVSVQSGCYAIRRDGSLWECPPNTWDEAKPEPVL